MRSLRHLLGSLFRRSRMESDMAEELRFHIQSRTEHLMNSGHSARDAARQARIEFGAVESYKESCRESSGLAIFDELRGNLRYTFRALRLNPGFTLAAVLSLAVGIGLNTVAFVSVSSIVLRPFPFPQLDRVMSVHETNAKLKLDASLAAPANFFDWKENSRSVDLGAFRPWNATLTGVDDPERVQAAQVSSGFFESLAMPARVGRTFTNGEYQPGRDAVAVVSDAFRKSHLATFIDSIGHTVTLNNRTYTIVGVMPDEFDYPLMTELWTPLALTPEERARRDRADLAVIGRLKPGVAIAQAGAELASISAALEQRYPKTNEGRGVRIQLLRDVANDVTDRFSIILLAAATFVLLLACANVANLQLARSTARTREIGLRAALGAGRFRIARELITESIVIALLSGIVGILLGAVDLRIAKAAIPAEVFQWVAGLRSMHLDAGTAALSVLLSLVAGTCCSIPAIYRLLREQKGAGLNEVLKDGGRSATAGSSRSRARNVLVVVEVALSLVLLVGAGLMVRTFQRVLNFNLGYDTSNLLNIELTLSDTNYRDNAQLARFYDQAVRGLNTIPGIIAAGGAGGMSGGAKFSVEGRDEPRAGEPRPYFSAVTPRYFDAMRIPLIAGRAISDRDGPDAQRVVVLSESVARHYWPGSSAIGRRIRLSPESPWLTVAGVSGDIKDWFSSSPEPRAYTAYQQQAPRSMRFFVRVPRDPLQFAAAARAQIRAVDRNQPVYNVKSMQQIMAEETSGVQAAATRMTIYAVISFLLAILGCYAVGSFSVARRTQEIGVRMTLGASQSEILKMVLGQTARLTAIGLAAGLSLAIALARVKSNALYGVVAVEPLTFVLLTALLAMAALLAGYIPARRASRIDPMAALRNE